MGWLTTYTAANKVDLSKRSYPDRVRYFATAYVRTITESRYKYVGMTQAAAETAQAALNSIATNVLAVAKKEGPGGNWMVEVTTTTYGAWS